MYTSVDKIRLFVADGPDLEAKGLVGRPEVGREEIDDRKLVQLVGAELEDRLLLGLPVLPERVINVISAGISDSVPRIFWLQNAENNFAPRGKL
jgi:hypothetical protein